MSDQLLLFFLCSVSIVQGRSILMFLSVFDDSAPFDLTRGGGGGGGGGVDGCTNQRRPSMNSEYEPDEVNWRG